MYKFITHTSKGVSVVHVCNYCLWPHYYTNHRDVPGPVAEVRTGDFNGDGVVDILTLVPVSEVKVRQCYVPTLYLCHVTDDGRVAVSSESM